MPCSCSNYQASEKLEPIQEGVRSEFDQSQMKMYCPECVVEQYSSNCNECGVSNSCIPIKQHRTLFDIEMQKKWCPDCGSNC